MSRSEALRYWLRLGCISFGGPAGQIAILHQDLVERRRWISERRFLHALNYCMLLPGPEAQQLATYIGWLLHGTWGGIIAGSLFVLPSLIVLILLSWIYVNYGGTALVVDVLYGIKPAVVAIVLFAAYRIGTRTVRNGPLRALAALAFVAVFAFNAPFPAIVLAAGTIGYIGSRYFPDTFRAGAGHHASEQSYGPAVIDDTTPPPAHARFSWLRFTAFLIIGLLLWAFTLGFIGACFGVDGVLGRMGWFFTKAALLTFGGAYAVLPYVYQGAVEQFQWLSAGQMMDGLALGETTPGPLIMVVAFVGYVGAATHAVFGPDALTLAGIAGAAVATYFTFLPSFLFIIVGGPLVEATHGDLKFTAPLTGITAAVVGVILNLALFFGYHVLWPRGFDQHFDLYAAAIGLVAAVALFRFKVGIVPVILACGGLGLMRPWLGVLNVM